ncbi:MAG TPA: MlaD family protein [Flavobacterium sp.]
MKLTREIKTAILVISSILLFIWGYSFLRGRDLFNDYKTLYVQYDNVEGLGVSSPVTLNGLVIGKIETITINTTTGKLVVQIQIKTDFPISKTSIAQIYSPSPIGGKQIALVPDMNNKVLVENGDFLRSTVKPSLLDSFSGQIDPLKTKLERVLDNADGLLTNVNEVLDPKTKDNLKSSIENLNKTLAEFSEASQSVNRLLSDNKDKLNSSISNFEKVSGNFSKLSDTLAKANIGRAVKNLERTLANVNSIVNNLESGKGTMGKLLKDDKLYNNFTRSSKELELLLQDVRLNPTRYINISVFGKKNKPYKAPSASDTITNFK